MLALNMITFDTIIITKILLVEAPIAPISTAGTAMIRHPNPAQKDRI